MKTVAQPTASSRLLAKSELSRESGRNEPPARIPGARQA